jgi:protein-tyrosine phosphatase
MSAERVERHLLWDRCINVRDLGGHPTEDGHTTRFGAVVRADAPRRLTDAGWQALTDYGVRTFVDLRISSEHALDPPRELPVDVVRVPVLPEYDHADWVEFRKLRKEAPTWEDAVRLLYVEWLARYPRSFAQAVEAVADAAEGVVLIHCEEGKDRTGLLAALLLRLAGVAAPEVVEDYAQSERSIRARLDDYLAGVPEEMRERRLQGLRTPAAAMLGVLQELERRHGDVRDYLLSGGADPGALERARARLRD